MHRAFLVLLGVVGAMRRQLRQGFSKPEGIDMVQVAPISQLFLNIVSEPVPLRVCNSGGSGACSRGGGERTIRAFRFLWPIDGPGVTGSSCLNRCDQAVPVMLPSGDIIENISSPSDCADVLQRLGYSVDKRLADAYAEAEQGDVKAASGNDSQALTSYKRAFSLALAAFGLDFSSRPSVIGFLQEAKAERIKLRQNSSILEALGVRTIGSFSSKRADSQNDIAKVTSFGQFDFGNAYNATVTREQARWLARVLVRRSRAYSRLARSAADAALGRKYALSRALDDAKYAVQVAETCVSKNNVEPILSQAWERLAESYEGIRDLEGAILAYEKLLAYEPKNTSGLPPSIVSKRAVQELVLVSHRRGLQDTVVVADGLREGLQGVGEQSRQFLTARALDDVGKLRKRADGDVDRLANKVRNDIDNVESFLLRVESRLLLGKQRNISKRARVFDAALAGVEKLRDKTRYQFNWLELSLLRGDPLLALIRDAVRDNAVILQQQKPKSLKDSFFGGRKVIQSRSKQELPDDLLPDTELVIWLREQVSSGALPADETLIANLLEETKRNPERVIKLVAEAAEAKEVKEREQSETESIVKVSGRL